MKSHLVCDDRRRELLTALGGATLLGALPLARAAGAREKIGVIGSGNVGSALGRVWAQAGHPVMFSSRNLDKDQKLAADVGPNASAGTPQQAAAFGDVLLLAVPYGAIPELGQTLGSALKGKVVIDASNPFPNRDGDIANEAIEKGAGVTTARLLPGARIVRAFNSIGAARMGSVHTTDPGKVGMPIAGDDKKAIAIASRLIKEIGFEPVLIGGLEKGKYLRPGQALSGEHTPDEIRQLAAKLEP
jgi:8-hydroxy-5-deazaflavin:NADPH oxidoreductase